MKGFKIMKNSTTEFMVAKEVAEYLNRSISYAYKIIAKLNKELEAQGYLTLKGQVQRSYFMTKFYKVA